jgi:hypothetical protein
VADQAIGQRTKKLIRVLGRNKGARSGESGWSQGECEPPMKSDKLKLTESTEQCCVPVETHEPLA